MQYMLLLFGDETKGPEPGTPEFAAEMKEWYAYNDALIAAGAMVGGEALQDSSTATVVNVVDGETVTTDGPFAETKEVLGGYYIIDVPDLDAAIHWAERNPAQPNGRVEIRPVMELPDELADQTTPA